MSEALDIYLNKVLCGQVTQKDGGSLEFEYNANYAPGQTPLSLSMPVEVQRHPNKSIRAYLQGLLPDNENALKGLAKRFDESPNSPFGILKHIGSDVAGAVEIYPEGLDPKFDHSEEVSLKLNEKEIESQLRGKIVEYLDGVVVTKLNERISLAGAQPKIALHKTAKGEWLTPNEFHLSTHILKPLTEKMKNQDLVEHITLLAARNLALNVCESEITSIGGLRVFIAKRYDRKFDKATNRTQRIHQEDFCQALSVSPAMKYQYQDGGPGVGQIARLISKLPLIENREAVSKAFFEGLVFNIYGRCPDAHAKNYSLILTNQEVSLAPLYDLTTGAPYGYTDYSAMSINNKYVFNTISESDLRREAKRLKIDDDWAIERVTSIHSGILEAFQKAGDFVLRQVENVESVLEVMQDIEVILARTQYEA